MSNPNLNQQQFYHASNHLFEVGDSVLPRRDVEFEPPGHPLHDPYSWDDPEAGDGFSTPREQWEDAKDSSAGYTYFSDNLEHGRSFARHTFEVEPTGPHWADHTPGTYESAHPLRVLRHVESRNG